MFPILGVIAAVATIIVGLISVFAPRAVVGFTGLSPQGGRGLSEIRAVLGGLFVALGAAPLLLQSRAAYQMLGWGYLGVAVVRAASILIDRSPTRSNWISLGSEIVLAVFLLV